MQLIQLCCRAIALAAVFGAMSSDASAVMQAPADRNDTIQATRDRGAPLGDVVIFERASGGYDTSDEKKWATNSWTCQSSTDAATGACPTTPVWGGRGSTTIELLFEEEKTGATSVLSLRGESAAIRHLDCNGAVTPEITSTYRDPIQTAMFYREAECSSRFFDGRSLFVAIPAEELKKLPSGGTWRANLRLNERKWSASNQATIAVFRAEITLNVTDKNNIQVYLPEFTSATPTVDLKLRKLANGSRMLGESTVDMCLYDGYNSRSTWFDVSASDRLTIDRRDSGQYSVLLDSDKSGAYDSRIDYNVSLFYEGKNIVLPNNGTVRLQGVNNSGERLVSLPGISVPVVCTPTPLTLYTPEFQSVWKRPGKYSNRLTITFTPSSASL
ncbi:pilin protein [Burkholderia seminalis]|uniref:CfaE/CblD family pilus tip adhesin n=1 Tax=Burkholderia seminalis TaxID=488731 RepID=UPI001CF272BD|nr:CfaE/CblD family pilus tip adhesin [Burkholderia seminalis]MCA8300110.1 pilin protein [Burkholderia seminalis]